MNTQAILEEMQARYEGRATVTMQMVKKSYGERLGLLIKANDKDYAPNIYLDSFEQFGDDLERICDEIEKTYEENKDYTPAENITSWIRDFENVRDRIQPRLVNPKACEGYLDDKVYREFADLALVYSVELVKGENGTSSIVVSNGLLEMWDGITEADLYEAAGKNITPKMVDIIEVVAKRYEAMGFGAEMREAMLEGMGGRMFVLSNGEATESLHGAGVLPFMLEELSERFKKFVVIPSSVHEVIIVPTEPECFEPDKEELANMVNDVNTTQVDVWDRLSDHAYFWNGSELMI